MGSFGVHFQANVAQTVSEDPEMGSERGSKWSILAHLGPDLLQNLQFWGVQIWSLRRENEGFGPNSDTPDLANPRIWGSRNGSNWPIGYLIDLIDLITFNQLIDYPLFGGPEFDHFRGRNCPILVHFGGSG